MQGLRSAKPLFKLVMFCGAQLSEGLFSALPGLLFLLFKNISSDNFLCYFYEHPIINLLTK